MPLAQYQGLNLVPGMGVESFSAEHDLSDMIYGPIHHVVYLNHAVVDGAARDSSNSPTTVLRPGLVVGKVTATNKWKQFDPAAVDGTEVARGILAAFGLNTQYDDADGDRFLASILVKGNLNPEGLCLFDTDYGLTRTGDGATVRTHLMYNFSFSDDFINDLGDPVSGR